MAWQKLIPANTGGGRKREMIAARLDASGQFSMTHAVADMLGDPDRVTVEVNPEERQIRLRPTTPDDRGAFSLSGGGNASHRIRMAEATKKWPNLVGEYTPRKMASGVLFVHQEDDGELTL